MQWSGITTLQVFVFVKFHMLLLESEDNEERRGANGNKKMKITTITAYETSKRSKLDLVDEATNMQKELEKLKLRLLAQQRRVNKATLRTQTEIVVLHEFIQEHHFILATTQAVISCQEQQSLSTLQPVQSLIHLGRDPEERYRTLLALREHKLFEEEQYLTARMKELNPVSSYGQEGRFVTLEGDFCFTKFETDGISGVSAKVAFNAILGCVLNSEAYLSEMFGAITFREDTGLESAELAQHRLVSSISSGAIVESNTVLFSRFQEDVDGRGSYGISVYNLVESDELYPYKTSERVRRDTTTIAMVRSVPRTQEEQPDIVVSRWTYLKIHNCDADISQNGEREMMESSLCWGDTAQKFIS